MRLQTFEKLLFDRWVVPPKVKRASAKNKELVRQWLLNELISSYMYPRDWLVSRTELQEDGATSRSLPTGFFGFCLITSKGDPFLWASIEEEGKGEKAESRLREILKACPYARLGVSYDGTKEGTRFLRQRINTEEADVIQDIDVFTLPDRIRFTRPFRAPAPNETEKRALEPISSALEDVFYEAHSHVRDIDGLHADEALDELCKVLYAKLYDEEMTPSGEPYSLQRGLTGTTEEFGSIIRKTYREANEYDVRVFSLKVPGYERSRGVFNSEIRLTTPALVKVVETLERYWLSRSSVDVKGRAFQRVLVPGLRAGMGQYFTPQEIIRLMVEIAAPTLNDLILDPFAGSGHFLTRSLDVVRQLGEETDGKRLNEFAFNKLHGIEKSDRMVRIAMTDMRLHGDGHSNIRCTDALLDFQNYSDIRRESFDVILTNPPFGSLLGPEAISQLGQFALAEGRRSVPLELLGLERCVEFLRPGGRLGIVLPDGVLVNRKTEYARDWLAEQVKVRSIISLPIATFSPFGANIKTSILFARKWKSGERKEKEYSVQLSRIDNIGYDAAGRPIDGSELDIISKQITEFIKSEGW